MSCPCVCFMPAGSIVELGVSGMRPANALVLRGATRYDWISPVVGVVILALGLYFVATASANVVEIGVVDTALGTGWLLGSLMSVGIARGQNVG